MILEEIIISKLNSRLSFCYRVPVAEMCLELMPD